MRNRWKRSLAMLLLVATLVSLLGTGAFAAGGESATPAPQSDATPAPTAEAAPSDGEKETPSAGSSEEAGTKTACTVTFYGYSTGQLLKTVAKNAGETLTAEDIPTSVSHWLADSGSGDPVGMEPDALVGMTINTNYTFRAAYKVTYCYTSADGADVTSFEYVLPGATGSHIPSGVERWTTKEGGEYTAESILGVTHAISDTTFYEYKEGETAEGIVTLTIKDYDGNTIGTIEQDAGAEIESSKTIDFNALGVSGWIMQYEGEEETTSCHSYTPTFKPVKNATIYAAYYVTYCPPYGEGTHAGELVLKGEKPIETPPQVNLGGKVITVAGWLDSEGKAVDPKTQVICADTAYYAQYYLSLNTDPSVAYVNGVADANNYTYTFQPDGSLTRAQAAKLLYELLDPVIKETTGPKNVSFPDVPAPGSSNSRWFSTAVYHLASYGLLNGTGTGKFEPDKPITRGDFVTIVSRLFPTETYTGSSPFADVTNTKASYYNAVMTAASKGWVNGYTTSKGAYFYPNNPITRAEAVKVLNHVIGRTPTETDKARIDGYDWTPYVDINSSWAYYEIMQAATGCGHSLPSTNMSAGRHKIKLNGSEYYVFVTKAGQLSSVDAGLNVMPDGKSYYFTSAGATAPVYAEGLFNTGKDLYLLSSDGSVIREPKSGYDTRVYEYKNHMYYIQEDGTLLQNEKFGYLYFGSNGAYTSGDKKLDTWVNNFISSHNIINNNKTQENKLYAAYVAVRDYPLEVHKNGALGYVRYNLEGYTWQEHASLFFERAKGTCEDWAYAMIYLAQRIGYDACAAVGKLKGVSNTVHVWELIKIRGTWYAFDVEHEWGFMYLHYNPNARSDRDCWKMKYADGETLYYGYRFDGTTYGDRYAGARNIWSPYIYSYFNA